MMDCRDEKRLAEERAMKAAFDAIAYWLIDFYLAATVVLIVVAVAQRIISQPARRLALHWGALIGLSLLVFLCLLPGWPRIDVMGVARAIPGSLSSSTPRVSAIPTDRGHHSVSQTNQQASTAQSSIGSTGAPHSVSSNSAASAPPAATLSSNPIALWRWLSSRDLGPARLAALVLFAVGCTLTTFRVIHGVFAARRVRLSALQAPRRVVAELKKLVGQGRCPELLVARSHPIPIVTGTLKPKILLPSQFAERERPDDCRSVLAHELAHIHNGDLWLLALDRWLLPLLWMHPLYLRLRRALRDDQELLADSYAASHSSRTDYADMLVRWARRLAAEKRARQLAAVGVWDRPNRLHDRIARLLHPSQRLELCCPRLWRMGTLLALIALPILLSTATVSPGSPSWSDIVASWSTQPTRPKAALSQPTCRQNRCSHATSAPDYFYTQEQTAISAVHKLGGSMRGQRVNGSWFVTEVDMRYPESCHRIQNGPVLLLPAKQNKAFPESVLSHIATFRHLRSLVIAHEQVTDSGMRQVCALSELESLTLQDARRLTGAGVAELAKLPRLRRLQISNAKFDDEAFEELRAAPHLDNLTIDGTNLSEKAIEIASHMPNLRSLSINLPNRLIGRDALSSLHVLPKLKHLSLTCFAIPDEGLLSMRSLTGLRSLSLCSHVNTDALALLRRSLPYLTVRSYRSVVRARSVLSSEQTNYDSLAPDDTAPEASDAANLRGAVASAPVATPPAIRLKGSQLQVPALRIEPALTDVEWTLSFVDDTLTAAVSREFSIHLDSSLVFKCLVRRVGRDWKIERCVATRDGVDVPLDPVAAAYLKGRASKEWSAASGERTID
jgi:beta-lactamase regulating signal transducer with metallopeptidase domain